MRKGYATKLPLSTYLDLTVQEHNGLGYADLVALLRSDVKQKAIAKAFNVSRRTIYEWGKKIELDKEEL